MSYCAFLCKYVNELSKKKLYYHCKCCNFSTQLKSNYTRHLQTKKHKNAIQMLSKVIPI